ncbi:hypothetical protein C900_05524 [Fulvivirga imtechensis AK7]|uniref:Uncharacterized protein n=1 Tax=Fulvivirga imtechensis AK7 TaxID=1237149 RepID=L8JNC6_9BACT|nr:hypothetical protein C900_05524 [Fulvivirga imtechensis AK7]
MHLEAKYLQEKGCSDCFEYFVALTELPHQVYLLNPQEDVFLRLK